MKLTRNMWPQSILFSAGKRTSHGRSVVPTDTLLEELLSSLLKVFNSFENGVIFFLFTSSVWIFFVVVIFRHRFLKRKKFQSLISLFTPEETETPGSSLMTLWSQYKRISDYSQNLVFDFQWSAMFRISFHFLIFVEFCNYFWCWFSSQIFFLRYVLISIYNV